MPRTTKKISSKTTKTESFGPNDIALSLGANLGDPESTLLWALDQLRERFHSITVSHLYRTEPVSEIDQPEFLNLAVTTWTHRKPEDILDIIQAIERTAGRRRDQHHGPRILDIDLLLYGFQSLELPHLTIPHPRLGERRFVLAPLADIAANFPVPPEGITVEQLLAEVRDDHRVERIPWTQETSLNAFFS